MTARPPAGQGARRKDRDVTRYWKLVAAVVAIAALTLAAAACGGDGDEDGGDEDRPAAEETKDTDADDADAGDDNGADTDEEGDDDSDDDAEDEGEDSGVESTGSLADLDSYRFALSMDIEGFDTGLGQAGKMTAEIDGAFVAPNRLQATCSGSVGPISFEEEVIRIGADSWIRNDATGGDFVEGESDFCTEDFTARSLLEAFEGTPLRGIKGEDDEVNGVDAVHYSFDREALEELDRLAQVFGAGGLDGSGLPEDLVFEMDIWLAKDGGWPVKVVMDMSGSEDGQKMTIRVTADITDANEDIEIEAP